MKRSSRVLTDISTVVLSISASVICDAMARRRISVYRRFSCEVPSMLSLSAYVGRMASCASCAPLELVW
ncbi:hypothetical protein IMSAGC006_02019 [Muribaculaceae bacterium]|nr:hypothetical protein IMSAGC006_02019 [Muribaculaceae bacterium]